MMGDTTTKLHAPVALPSNTVVYLPSDENNQIALEIKVKNTAGDLVAVEALFDTRCRVSLITETLFRGLGYIISKTNPATIMHMLDGRPLIS